MHVRNHPHPQAVGARALNNLLLLESTKRCACGAVWCNLCEHHWKVSFAHLPNVGAQTGLRPTPQWWQGS